MSADGSRNARQIARGGGTTPLAVAPSGFYYLLDLEVPRLMLRTPRASVCLEFKTVFNVLIACWTSTSDQAESASVACSISRRLGTFDRAMMRPFYPVLQQELE